jgi:hypothetical protein
MELAVKQQVAMIEMQAAQLRASKAREEYNLAVQRNADESELLERRAEIIRAESGVVEQRNTLASLPFQSHANQMQRLQGESGLIEKQLQLIQMETAPQASEAGGTAPR